MGNKMKSLIGTILSAGILSSGVFCASGVETEPAAAVSCFPFQPGGAEVVSGEPLLKAEVRPGASNTRGPLFFFQPARSGKTQSILLKSDLPLPESVRRIGYWILSRGSGWCEVNVLVQEPDGNIYAYRAPASGDSPWTFYEWEMQSPSEAVKKFAVQPNPGKLRRFRGLLVNLQPFSGGGYRFGDVVLDSAERPVPRTWAWTLRDVAEDISYQSARKEARETAFTVMSSLFNYFPADSHVQLQVVNAPIPADEVGRKVFFEPGERATAGLAEEYNRILNDKMREGVSNLVRHRYLTYAVGADDVDAAVPKLARIRGDVGQTLARIRCSSRALDGAERLELLQGQLRPGSRFEFSWDKLSPTSGARTKDFVMPSTLDFKPEGRSDCFCSDGRYGAVLAVRSFGSVIEETYLASIIDLPLPLNVTLHVQPIAQSEALALVKRQIDWMDKEIIDEQMSAVKKGYDYQILPPELRFSKEEAEELLDFLRNKSERLFVYTGLVYTWADSLEELDRRVQQVTSVAQGCTIGLEPLHFRQRQALNSVLPLGDNHVTVSRYLTTGQVAMQMPFASQSLDEAGGGYYGQSKESGNLVLCDRKRLASPMGFVSGKPGSGKSFSVKREITNTVLAHPEDEVVIFDPAGEYGNLVGALGGANVELAPGCSAVLNPLDTADVADRADAAKLAYKTDAVLALSSALMAEGREGLPERDRSIIARCVGEAYRECARDGRLPTLGDFHAALLAQPEPEAADIALRYERYVKGAFSFFNGQSNVALDNRITNIDMHGLGQNMRVFGMITALEMVRNRVMVTPPRPNYTWLYIDEVQSLFAHPTVVEYFARLWREGRKFGLICTGISQNTSHMLANAEARDMVLNSEFFLLHKQSTADLDAWAEMLQLSATERGYIGDAVKPGEGLLISAGIRVPITDDFPKGSLYDLWNTKPAEVAEREMRRAAREAEE